MTNDDRIIGVYLIQEPESLKTYVGSGFLETRFKNHHRSLKKGDHYNPGLQEMFDSGKPLAVAYVETETTDEARALEQSIIDEFIGQELFVNQSVSAYRGVPFHREAAKEKLRILFKGRDLGPEWRKKISEANKGKKRSEEHIAKIIAANTGREVSSQTRELLRIASTGRLHSEESRRKMSEVRTGRVIDEEWRKNLSEATKGVPKTQEHVDKAAKGHYKEVIADGVKYESLSAFAVDRGIPLSTASRWVSDPRKDNIAFLDKQEKE